MTSKIVVITQGRFHSFDLAEQLQRAGRLGAIYTGYPRFKLKNTQVDPQLIRCFPWLIAPAMLLMRNAWFPSGVLNELFWQGSETLNRYAARTLPECSLVSALSGSGRESGLEIHRRGGAFVCDRGSTHILWAKRYLDEEYERLGLAKPKVDPRPIENEAIEYELADAITLPSQFTRDTFVEMGVPAEKLRVVPYGVDLATFSRKSPQSVKFRVIFVGQLSIRKGLHYLLSAFNIAQLPGAELVLVGGETADTAELFRRHPVENMTVLGHVGRDEVIRQLSLASVMVLPSLEEGLARVLGQAMACGCPVIASTNTGAADLFEDGKEGFIVPVRQPLEIAERLTRLYRNRDMIETMGKAAASRVKKIAGWQTYGRMMIDVFDQVIDGRIGLSASDKKCRGG